MCFCVRVFVVCVMTPCVCVCILLSREGLLPTRVFSALFPYSHSYPSRSKSFCAPLPWLPFPHLYRIGHAHSHLTVVSQTTEVIIEPLSPEQRGEGTVNVDGENIGFSPVKVKCLARLLPIIA